MSVRIKYRLSEAGRKAMLLADPQRTCATCAQEMTVPSSDPDYHQAVALAQVGSDGYAIIDLLSGRWNVAGNQTPHEFDHVPTVAELLAEAVALRDAKQKAIVEQEVRKKEYRDGMVARVAAWLASHPDPAALTLDEAAASGLFRVPEPDAYHAHLAYPQGDLAAALTTDQMQAVLDGLQAVQNLANARFEDRRAQQDRERQAAAEAARRAKARLKDWAQAYGSELLRARVVRDYQWDALARREYASALLREIGVPGTGLALIRFEDDTTSWIDNEAPPLADLRAEASLHDRISKLSKDGDAAARLGLAAHEDAHVTVSCIWFPLSAPGRDDDDDDDDDDTNGVVVTIRPFGTSAVNALLACQLVPTPPVELSTAR